MMAIFYVVVKDQPIKFEADIVDLQDKYLRVIKDHKLIAEFSVWDYWFEEGI